MKHKSVNIRDNNRCDMIYKNDPLLCTGQFKQQYRGQLRTCQVEAYPCGGCRLGVPSIFITGGLLDAGSTSGERLKQSPV